jgi:Zn-dependent protease with chaperone function
LIDSIFGQGASMEFQVHPREKVYLNLMIVVSLLCYAGIIGCIYFGYGKSIAMQGAIFGLLMVFMGLGHLIFMGRLKGNAIKVTPKQFPDIYEIVKNQSEKLGLETVPTMYLLQGNGMLNAFATKFLGRNYVVVLSDILEAAYQEGRPAVEFIIGHELGHLKRKHASILKAYLLFPARMMPFLSSAYSRACEYTSDSIGYSLCPEGAEKGMLILAAGKELYKKVNVSELLLNAQAEKGFLMWFAEIFSTHPHMVKRIAVFNELNKTHLTQDAFVHQKDTQSVREKSL